MSVNDRFPQCETMSRRHGSPNCNFHWGYNMTRFCSFALSAVTALSLSVAPAPAAADGSDVAKVLAGLAVIGILAKAADDRRDRRKATAQTTYYPQYDSLDHRAGKRAIDGELRRLDQPRHARNFKKRPLPDRCLRVLDNDRGRDRLVYASRCLNRNYQFASRLPDYCQRFVRTSRGTRVVYGSRCLARDGWRVARR